MLGDRRCGRNLGLSGGIVHVFIRGSASSRAALYQAGQTSRRDHSSTRLPDEERAQNWHREYEQRLDLPAGYVRVPRYSQALKERAVEHYLEHGRCLSATIKALGYPSRTLLPAWIQELHPEPRTRVVGRPQGLTPSMKQAAVIALCMRQGSAQSVAQELGVSRPSLYNWKNQLLSHDPSASMKRQQDSPPGSGTSRAGTDNRGASTRHPAPAAGARPAEEGE